MAKSSLKKVHPLKAARKKRGITLIDLGNKVGSNSGNLSRIERFEQTPSLGLAERIAALFAGELTEMHLLYPERYAQDAN